MSDIVSAPQSSSGLTMEAIKARARARRPDIVNVIIDAGGGVAVLARHFGLNRQAISQWRHRIPIKYVLELERLTGVPRHVQRPDIYPPENTKRRR
jgi:hypothetical protein